MKTKKYIFMLKTTLSFKRCIILQLFIIYFMRLVLYMQIKITQLMNI